eukprot:CAMPEP_0196601840 /NCGR_PEP_ID=MMETSP1081-20130531/96119_1 /TAXON_ID=36882 /ORGANISM="Pyramimonas amylifera, Strain CCMP720" /LENGTH=291 /DNA_ID=CAMNT_0041927735 /DNA_START=415 /DNA_END=1290 /DNA_ORIENTATION=-
MPSFVELLESMHKILGKQGFEQLPQLSASRRLDLHSSMKFLKDPTMGGSGRTKALLIGINYAGSSAELRGCHNDVHKMRKYICSQGFLDNNECMKILMDDGAHASPTMQNMLAAFEWLHQGAQPGDSLFFHYSGHGGNVKDDSGDEADGRDETLIPVDYETAGQIRDDTIYAKLITVLPKDCQMISVMDCCHSGSVFDLPYMFVASEGNLSNEDQPPQMILNPQFDIEMVIAIGKKFMEFFQEVRNAKRDDGGIMGIAKSLLGLVKNGGTDPKIAVPAALLVLLFKMVSNK